MTGVGISAYGTYVPQWRLTGAVLRSATGTGTAKGSRSVAGHDEDTTTLAVEAARDALRDRKAAACSGVVLATAAPVYADKTNATALHAALGLPENAHAADATGAVRSGISALLSAMYRPGSNLVALSDIRLGATGSADEAGGGDGAAAFVVGSDPALAEFVASGSATREFLDRWRAPGEPWSATWEERFGEDVYRELGVASFEQALKTAGLTADDVDAYAVTGLSERAARRVAAEVGVLPERISDDLVTAIGNCGTAHPGLVLAAMFDAATPGAVVALTVLADGADTVLFRMREDYSPPADTLAARLARDTHEVSYTDFLAWRGLVHRQPPRRPDPDRAVAPASHRALEWKFGFTASQCVRCSTRHLPPQRVCLRCGAVDEMQSRRLADTPATIATFTVDHLGFSLAPPVVAAVIDFDGGGRFLCELTDVDANRLSVGDRVEMTFRRISTANGIHNYFWKARPRRGDRPE